jgi:GH25 family lysozyme M1 (1,4-beta-N-acetylmuramidase)
LPQTATLAHPPTQRLVTIALLCAALLFAVSAMAGASPVLGAGSYKATACSVNLRNNPYTTAKLRATLKKDTRVTVTVKVTGGRWKATCAGNAVSGRGWWRIVAIGGKSIQSLFGRPYVYGAAGMFKSWTPPSFTKYTACRVNLRTSASTSATSKDIVPTDTKTTVAVSVSGTSWSTTCGGATVSGSSWYRISAINDKSVQSLYGTPYVYSASGLFKNAPTPASAPTPTPTPPGSTPTPTPTPTAAPTPTPQPTPMPGTTDGIDVSHWQNTINWTSVAAAGKKFAFMKASEDVDYVDPTYQTNRAQAKAAGLLVGAYHFAQPSSVAGNGAAQADHFLAAATPTSGELFPVLDLERSNGLGTAALTTWVRGYLDRIYQRTGVRAIIYCSPNFWQTYMGNTNWFALNGYQVLWIAHWTTAPAPSVPAGGWGGNGWTFWQYSSSGSVPGITGRVDLNRFNGTDFRRVLIP